MEFKQELRRQDYLSKQDEVIEKLFAKLPRHYRYEQNWHFTNSNFLYLVYSHFIIKPKYTYFLDKSIRVEDLYNNLASGLKRDIVKGNRNFIIEYNKISNDEVWRYLIDL